MMRCEKKQRTARFFQKVFSLVELLVVIAIIALLCALLFPALKKAKDQAIAVNCKSNLKQMGLSLSSYAADYQGWFPKVFNAPMTWVATLTKDRYVPVRDTTKVENTILRCPGGLKNSAVQNYWTYGMNIKNCDGGILHAWKIDTRVHCDRTVWSWTNPKPSDFLLLTDSILSVDPGLGPQSIGNQFYVVGYHDGYDISLRHQRRANALFGDMGVRGRNDSDLIADGWVDYISYQP